MPQRIWYVFRDDKTHGPFDESEILEQKADGLILPLDQVWSEGMENWTPLHEAKLPDASKEIARQGPNRLRQISHPWTPAASNLNLEPAAAHQYRHHTFWKLKLISKRGLRSLGVILMLAIGFTSYKFYQQHLIQNRLRAIESLPKIADEDLKELRRAATEPFNKFGISAAIALTRFSAGVQKLVLVTNVAGTAHFEVQVVGNPETLVDATQARGHISVTTQNGIGFDQFTQEGTQQLPRGEYQFRVYSALNNRISNNPLTEKTLFLGKPKDFEYTEALKSYHTHLRQKAHDELLELGQFASMIEEQLTQTVSEFQAATLNETDEVNKEFSQRREPWENFDVRWTALSQRLEASAKKWTPGWLSSTAFYAPLFKKAKEVTFLVKKIHEEQSQTLAQPRRSPAAEIKIAKSASIAQSLILALKAKIQLMEKIPLTVTGMPQQTLPQELDGL